MSACRPFAKPQHPVSALKATEHRSRRASSKARRSSNPWRLRSKSSGASIATRGNVTTRSPLQSNGASIAAVPYGLRSKATEHRSRQCLRAARGIASASLRSKATEHRSRIDSTAHRTFGAGGDCLDPTAIEHRSPVLRELHQDVVSIPQPSSIDRDASRVLVEDPRHFRLDPTAIEHRSRLLARVGFAAWKRSLDSTAIEHRSRLGQERLRSGAVTGLDSTDIEHRSRPPFFLSAPFALGIVSIPQTSSIDRDHLLERCPRCIRLSRFHSHRASIATQRSLDWGGAVREVSIPQPSSIDRDPHGAGLPEGGGHVSIPQPSSIDRDRLLVLVTSGSNEVSIPQPSSIDRDSPGHPKKPSWL